MKKVNIIIALLVLIGNNSVLSQFVSMEESKEIANNWIQIITDKYGHWGSSDSAYACTMQELRKDNRLIGYYCNINPKGFIVISLRKELATVKTYSEFDNINFSDENGMTALIKLWISHTLDVIEAKFGSIESVNSTDLSAILEIDYRKSWDYIENYIPGSIKKMASINDDYQEGEILLSSEWHQDEPYNNDCPWMDCESTSNGNVWVGCVATAGAQIMRYWDWPPYGVGSPYNDAYDWPNMPDFANSFSPTVQKAAVAELCHEVGVAADMDYGCEGSGSYPAHMADAYLEEFRFDGSLTLVSRNNYTPGEWWTLIKENINKNRPIQYYVVGHSIICDGWRVDATWGNEYHMNYGDGGSPYTSWWLMDYLYLGDPNVENMTLNIFPSVALGANLYGFYTPQAFPYRYFDQDASGVLATFYWGQMLQTLPNITITGIGTNTYVEFLGLSNSNINIFTGGDPSEGIVVKNGTIRLKNNGSIKLSEP